jgi:hypothetical protein
VKRSTLRDCPAQALETPGRTATRRKKDPHHFKEGVLNQFPEFSFKKQANMNVILILALVGFVLSCSIFAPEATPIPSNTPQPTETVAPAATDTPLPSDTSEPTATKKATADKAATRRAQEEETAAAQTESAGAILGEIEDKLDEVGEFMGDGNVVWLYSSAVVVESSKANMIYYKMLDSSIRAADFAYHTVITWETKGNAGIVNCVIMFRIGDDIDMDPWYSLRLSRISGASAARFDLWQKWSIIGPGSWNGSSYIRDGNGDENELILVAKQNQFTAYINGRQVAVWWNSKIESGRFGLGTLQDYGTTTCTYGENWIWEWA